VCVCVCMCVGGGVGGGRGGGLGEGKDMGFLSPFFPVFSSLKGKSHLQSTARTPNMAATTTDARPVKSVRHEADQKRPAVGTDKSNDFDHFAK